MRYASDCYMYIVSLPWYYRYGYVGSSAVNSLAPSFS